MNNPSSLNVTNTSVPHKFNFRQYIKKNGISLDRQPLTTLQINVGRVCNQACRHCHVDAGPKHTESMSKNTVDRILELLSETPCIKIVDITGGAPELNPHFRFLVRESLKLGKKVIDRCNLTILLYPGQENLAEFLADHSVEIVASLPCYLQENVDSQRGQGVYENSIKALRKLNLLGYGKPDTGLILNLVYNPGGAFLPPSQVKLEQQYKERLNQQFGVEFNQLLTITNMPINRFAYQLSRENKLDSYMSLLVQSFNPQTVNNLMCRSLISVSWTGELFDCDFNQTLEMPVPGKQKTLWDIKSLEEYQEKRITTGFHCFGCTAGSGSSCGGALAS